MHQLAWQFGYPKVSELAELLTSNDFDFWVAFLQLGGPDQMLNSQLAQIAYIIAQTNCTKTLNPANFLFPPPKNDGLAQLRANAIKKKENISIPKEKPVKTI